MQTPAQFAAWKKANPDRLKIYQARADAKRNATPELRRIRQIHRKYRVTREQAKKLIAQAASGCQICGCVMTRFTVDHCHTFGDVRGILCPRCNVQLAGVERDHGRWLIKALIYLQRAPLFERRGAKRGFLKKEDQS